MKIQIELIVIFLILAMFFLWFVWFKISGMIAKKRYNPDNDRSKKGEIRIRKNGGEVQTTGTSTPSSSRYEQLTERDLLPTTVVDNPRKNCSSIRDLLKRTRE